MLQRIWPKVLYCLDMECQLIESARHKALFRRLLGLWMQASVCAASAQLKRLVQKLTMNSHTRVGGGCFPWCINNGERYFSSLFSFDWG
jgi:hypothetical protein